MSRAQNARDTASLTSKEIGLCSQFSEFTSASQEVSAICLRRHQWNIHLALEAFWENPQGFLPPPPACDVGLLETMFEKYKDEDEDAIGVDGLVQFCEDLGIAPDDVRMLIFCFNLKVASAVRWTKQEFVQGMVRTGCDSVQKVLERIPSMQADLVDPSKFKQFYAFVFDVSKSDGQKVLDLQMAISLWKMILAGKFAHLDLWCTYLEAEYRKSITRDTWMLTYEFALQADATMGNIDLASSAWPVVIDEFVEYFRAKNP